MQALGLEYVDLFLIHWPTAFKVRPAYEGFGGVQAQIRLYMYNVLYMYLQSGEDPFPKDEQGELVFEATDYLETWRGMEDCFEQKLAKAIGVSNFNSKQLQRLLDNGTVCDFPRSNTPHVILQ